MILFIQIALAVGQLAVPCDRSRYGCCADKSTTAKGPNKEGCPGMSKCFCYFITYVISFCFHNVATVDVPTAIRHVALASL